MPTPAELRERTEANKKKLDAAAKRKATAEKKKADKARAEALKVSVKRVRERFEEDIEEAVELGKFSVTVSSVVWNHEHDGVTEETFSILRAEFEKKGFAVKRYSHPGFSDVEYSQPPSVGLTVEWS